MDFTTRKWKAYDIEIILSYKSSVEYPSERSKVHSSKSQDKFKTK